MADGYIKKFVLKVICDQPDSPYWVCLAGTTGREDRIMFDDQETAARMASIYGGHVEIYSLEIDMYTMRVKDEIHVATVKEVEE